DDLVQVTFIDSSKQARQVEGLILVKAVDGGILLEGRDGRLWNVTPQRLNNLEKTGKPFSPLSAEELGQQLQAEFGERFSIITTRHFVICSSADPRYTRWCGRLFERLLTSFRKQWRRKETDLNPPGLPLPAIVFSNRQEFADYAAQDAGAETAASAKGYYSIKSNRMVLYDLTAELKGSRPKTPAEINTRLAASAFNVATIVHEATHQIAFNTGMHIRYADNPLWLTEGMAMYFETPDLKSKIGWKTAGKVNGNRNRRFREFLANRRGPDSLSTLIQNDKRFTGENTISDAYAEAWALSHYLIRTKRKAYLDYLERISSKPRLIWDKPEQRLAEFKAAFGEDLEKLDRKFLRYMKRLRVR
ncbi:MAG: DUF1570 domain-containing protein, partial [Planctomycetes bacterium]|nr:DUF1570 domain-containing protein [Planctomycetota bacterium]